MQELLDIIEDALARAGYDVFSVNGPTMTIGDENTNYEIKIEETPK